MDCKRASELFVDYLYDEMAPTDRAALENHLRQCSRCSRELKSLKATRGKVQAAKEYEPPVKLEGRILEAAASAARDGKSGKTGNVVLQVFILKNGEFVGTELFAQNQVVVGRDPTVADLVLESAQVSRKHALLEHDGTRVRVGDAGSTNGVFIANQRIKTPTEVGRLDEILLGDYSLKVKLVSNARESEIPSSSPPTRIAVSPILRERRESGLKSQEWQAREPSKKERPAPPAGNERPTRAEDSVPPVAPRDALEHHLDDWDDRSGAEPITGDERVQPGRKKERSRERELDGGRAYGDESDEHDSIVMSPIDSNEEHDDEDEEYEQFVPPFSLVDRMKRDDAVADRHAEPWLEVLDIQGDQLSSVQMLQPGEGYWIGPEIGVFLRAFARELPPRMRLLKHTHPGHCRVEMRKELKGTLHRGGHDVRLDAIPELQKNRRRGTVCMELKVGETLDLVDQWHSYHVRFVPPPADMRDPRPLVKRVQPDKESMRSMVASVGGHIAFAVLMTIFAGGEPVALPTEKKEEFVEVALDAKQELEEPPPPPEEKQPEKQAAVEKVPESMSAKPLPKNVRPKAGGTSKAPPGVLGLLSKRGSSAAPGPAAAVAAVSNLLAAKGPGGASGGYKVSGLIGKLPSNQLSVGGGGGGLLTKGGASLLRGGGGGGGLLAGNAGTRTVGGLVQKDPKAMRAAGQGQLDRDEIQKVINDNINAIQRCYERELLKAPGLSGKVQVEWTIATSGSVRSVRQTYTSMNSTSVSNCIMGAIKSWRFPKPKGGEVIVNYPFIFKSIGF